MKKVKKAQVEKNIEIGHHVLLSFVGHIDKDFVFERENERTKKET